LHQVPEVAMSTFGTSKDSATLFKRNSNKSHTWF
jgi:hypothetical protein